MLIESKLSKTSRLQLESLLRISPQVVRAVWIM
jgi:hypothetical protein